VPDFLHCRSILSDAAGYDTASQAGSLRLLPLSGAYGAVQKSLFGRGWRYCWAQGNNSGIFNVTSIPISDVFLSGRPACVGALTYLYAS